MYLKCTNSTDNSLFVLNGAAPNVERKQWCKPLFVKCSVHIYFFTQITYLFLIYAGLYVCIN